LERHRPKEPRTRVGGGPDCRRRRLAEEGDGEGAATDDAAEAVSAPVIDVGTRATADTGLADHSTIGAYLHELRRIR